MPRTHSIDLEPLSAEAFAPFGQLIAMPERPPVFEGPHIQSWRMDFSAEGPVELMYVRYRHQPLRTHRLERHFTVAQSFIPLDGRPSVMIVAGPTDAADRAALPHPDSVRAFYLEGTTGVLLWPAAWHALTRFPLHPEGGAFVMVTARATQQELEEQTRSGAEPGLTQVVDLGSAFGVELEVADPTGLIASA